MVKGKAFVNGRAFIYDRAFVYGRAFIYGRAFVNGRALRISLPAVPRPGRDASVGSLAAPRREDCPIGKLFPNGILAGEMNKDAEYDFGARRDSLTSCTRFCSANKGGTPHGTNPDSA